MEWLVLLLLLGFVLLCGLILILALYQPKITGYFGEKTVEMILTGLPTSEYKLINDVMLKTNYGTTQIDHVLLSVYGIFVIETKNYQGWITGGENSEQWTKNMYGKKYSFRNPLRQNYAHIKALENVLGIPVNSFIPIVVFGGNATIKVQTNQQVIYMSELRKVINQYRDVRFSVEDICMFENKIISANITQKEQRKEHVRGIQAKVTQNNMKIQSGECPKCGGKLVKRNGRYGAFFGCSNYPKCRYTRQV